MRRTCRLPLDQLAPYLLDLPLPPEPLDWRAVFGNEQPVELEIGFGKGLFLLTAVQACPQTNFLGVEIARKYQLLAATRLAKRSLRNVRLVRADARLFLRDYTPSASLQAIHVYFPDPWWKKRHWKRRLFTPEFAEQCARVLQPGGRLHVVTDVEDYFGVIVDLLGQTTLRPGPPPDPKQPGHDLDYLTNFERKFRKEGRAVYRASYARPPLAARKDHPVQ